MARPHDAALVGARLKAVRLWYGWVQDDIARLCDVARTQVSQWERGAQRAPFDATIKIKAHTGISLDFFYAGDFSSLPPVVTKQLLPFYQQVLAEAGLEEPNQN